MKRLYLALSERLAQLVERLLYTQAALERDTAINKGVSESFAESVPRTLFKRAVSTAVVRPLYTGKVAGSIPAPPTIPQGEMPMVRAARERNLAARAALIALPRPSPPKRQFKGR